MNEENFRWLRVGGPTMEYSEDKRIKVLPSTEGCKGCTFQNSFGAKHCRMAAFCMGHLRPDRTPVIFVVK